MNFFENDYTQNATNLFKEAFTLKKYKAMNPVLAVITAIFMLPVILLDAILACALYVYAFIFNLIFAPVRFIHDVLKAERGEVKHATQVVIYLISWPVLFFLYVSLAFTALTLNCLYALTAIGAYIWTLGGFKFHVSVEKSKDISITTNGKLLIIPIVYIIVCAVILILWPLIGSVVDIIKIVSEYGEYANVTFGDFLTLFKLGIINNIRLEMLFSIIYSAVAFGPRPSVSADDKAG